jgi:hypothetical protein
MASYPMINWSTEAIQPISTTVGTHPGKAPGREAAEDLMAPGQTAAEEAAPLASCGRVR